MWELGTGNWGIEAMTAPVIQNQHKETRSFVQFCRLVESKSLAWPFSLGPIKGPPTHHGRLAIYIGLNR